MLNLVKTQTNPIQSIRKIPIQAVLIAIALVYLALILFIPAVAVFYEAFHKGIGQFLTAASGREFIHAAQMTLIIAAIVVPFCTIFGTCAALVLARNNFPGRTLLISILDLPFAISPVVAGLMIVLLYGSNGWFAPVLKALNIQVLFSLPGMVMATLFVTLPFVAREVLPVLEEIGTEQEEAAHTLGANEWQTFWRVTLPNIKWGLLYGVLLTNARAMGEFGAVAVVSGLISGRTLTLPSFVEQAHKNYQDEAAFGAAAVLALLAAVTLVLKEILERRTARKMSA
ncbi:sulfate ABC transporter permease subunit CysW [Limnoraphis robusta]|uniref:Sulfate ABC transporter permease subunit CysW n=1 Tax=Limnoraphis robusta CCNP1315 TaxID=3110306 RepID=A0ABU5TWQ3_9CYAN|nr:sulfate ABC transporter permease subunit CysW [Limnoraphis robusta]MEA5519324.1 sulfate ABC transporter permease subunit CysW [Limnoraphis robusta CCNP1315]MEA5545582.1 sulfate ABC transporter permease subunit CysW [Limnoraphis robusta CCNP1324]